MADGLLLVAHGTRSAAGAAEAAELAARVGAAAPGLPVELGFLELSEPPAGAALDRLVARGVDRVGVVPAMLLAAPHSKSDVPAVVLEGRARHPSVEIAYGRPFGVDHALVELARARVAGVGADGLPLLVVARGTSDPDANAESYRAARLVAEATAAPLVQVGFSGVTRPSVAQALEHLRRLGATRVAAVAWFLATGVLRERMLADFAAAPVEVVDAGYLGPGPEVAALVLARFAEALAGEARANCDACPYRAPFPGLEERVGLPVGVGHSHLAASHRHHHP